MNRSLLTNRAILSLALLISIHGNVQPVHAAAPVFCINCGTESTQLLGKLTMAKQLATQAQQLKTQLNQYQSMVMNSKTLPSQLWNNTMRDFQQLTGIMQQSKALGYSTQNIAGQFASRFGNFNSYTNKNMTAADWNAKYAQWSQQNSDNALYTLQGLGVHANQMVNDQATLRRVQAMATTSQGQMQALQVANQMAGQSVDQIMKLRQLIMIQAQMQANYLAQLQDQEAAKQANRNRLLNSWKSVSTTDGQKF
jgi:P-type conjugative transfer protein TrbJ